MDLRRKTLIAVGIGVACVICTVAVATYLFMEQTNRVLEDQEVRQILGHMVRSLERDQGYLEANLRDYASWNDTYRFVLDHNEKYAAINLRSDLYPLFDIDAVLIFDEYGNIVAGEEYDFTTETLHPVPESLAHEVWNLSTRENILASPRGTAGFIYAPEGLALIASYPVLHDDSTGPAVGSMHMIRYLNNRTLAGIPAIVERDVQFLTPEKIAGDPILGPEALLLTDKNPVRVFPRSNDQVTGIMKLHGLDGDYYITATEPRLIYQQGQANLLSFVILLLIGGVFLTVFVVVFIDRVALSRLNSILAEIRKQGVGDEERSSKGRRSGDELVELARAIDPMLVQIDESRRKLRESEAQYRMLAENVRDVIFTSTIGDMHLSYISPSVTELLGYTPDEFLKIDPMTLLTPASAKVLQESRETLRGMLERQDPRSRDPTIIELEQRRKDGSLVWTEVIITVLWDTATGLPAGVIGRMRDISERKESENALRSSEEWIRHIVATVPAVLFHATEADGGTSRFTPDFVSEKIRDFLGYGPEKFLNNPVAWYEAIHADDRPVFRSAEQELERSGHAEIEYRLRHQDGSYRWVHEQTVLIANAGAAGRELVGSWIDVTSRKGLEEELQQANRTLEMRVEQRTEELTRTNEELEMEIETRLRAEKELQQVLEEKVLLLRELHHRVKNNMQIVASLLNLQARTITDPKSASAMRDSRNRVRVMAMVHERLYRSSDIAALDIDNYLRSLTNQILAYLEEAGPSVNVTVDVERIPVDIDTAIPLGLITNELLSNAMKYAFPGGGSGTVTIRGRNVGIDLYEFVFSDNGVGMPRDFDWRNAESLGLRLVNTLVEQMGGNIERLEGPGTAFRIVFRIRKTAPKNIEDRNSGI